MCGIHCMTTFLFLKNYFSATSLILIIPTKIQRNSTGVNFACLIGIQYAICKKKKKKKCVCIYILSMPCRKSNSLKSYSGIRIKENNCKSKSNRMLKSSLFQLKIHHNIIFIPVTLAKFICLYHSLLWSGQYRYVLTQELFLTGGRSEELLLLNYHLERFQQLCIILLIKKR